MNAKINKNELSVLTSYGLQKCSDYTYKYESGGYKIEITGGLYSDAVYIDIYKVVKEYSESSYRSRETIEEVDYIPASLLSIIIKLINNNIIE